MSITPFLIQMSRPTFSPSSSSVLGFSSSFTSPRLGSSLPISEVSFAAAVSPAVGLGRFDSDRSPPLPASLILPAEPPTACRLILRFFFRSPLPPNWTLIVRPGSISLAPGLPYSELHPFYRAVPLTSLVRLFFKLARPFQLA